MNKHIKLFLRNIVYTSFGDNFFKLFGIQSLYIYLNIQKQKNNLYAEAKKEFEKKSLNGNLIDYKNDLEKHLVSYSEYAYQFEFYKKSEIQKEEFISRLKMRHFYLRYTRSSIKDLFKDKIKFLTTFDKYIHRNWIFAPNATYEEFFGLVSNYDCIIKPINGSLGNGVFKVYKNSNRDEIKSLYDFSINKRLLVEECIDSCEELKAFHPQSLNTIRVVTISNRQKAEVFGAFFRVGCGDSVVDNAHAGGIFAQINIDSGAIESDGINTNREIFIYHPDTGIRFKGFRIPEWNNIIEACCEAAKLTDNIVTGWDVVINRNGIVEFIEGNNSPDFDVMQSPLQIGVKKRLYSLIKKYSGIEMN